MIVSVLFCMAAMANAVPADVASRIRHGDIAFIERYLAEGGDANATVTHGDYEFSLLYFAVMDGEYEIVKLLLEADANPNHYVVGSTILRHLDVEIDSLKEEGKDISAEELGRYVAIRALLEQYGGSSHDDEAIIGDMRKRLLQNIVTEKEDVEDDLHDREVQDVIIRVFENRMVIICDDGESLAIDLNEQHDRYKEALADLENENGELSVALLIHPGGARTAESIKEDLRAAGLAHIDMVLQPIEDLQHLPGYGIEAE